MLAGKFRGVFLKRLLLVGILSGILFSAHFESYFLWRLLATLGLDVSMTPVTVDMMFLSQSPASPQAYRGNYSLRWQSLDKSQVLPLEQWGFYELKIPVLLMMELVENKVKVDGHVASVCSSLKRKTGEEIISWTFLGAVGFEREWLCPPR